MTKFVMSSKFSPYTDRGAKCQDLLINYSSNLLEAVTCSFIKLTELIKVTKIYRSWREILIDFKYHIAFCLIIGPLASQLCRIFP